MMTNDSRSARPISFQETNQEHDHSVAGTIDRHKRAHKILQADMFNFDIKDAPVNTFTEETDAELLHWMATGGPKTAGLAWKELGRRRGWLFGP